MKSNEATLLLQAGAITGAHVYTSARGLGYILRFRVASGREVSTSLDLQSERGPVRYFKSYDVAVSAAKNIGFRKIEIYIEDPPPVKLR